MKKHILIALVAFSSAAAFADGFVCTSQGLNVKIYNNTDPSVGTREGAVVVLSDPSVNAGRKTIARFTDVSGNLTNKGAHYVANVDLRFADLKRGGENIAGTKLRELDVIHLDLDFSYGAPVNEGDEVQGSVTLIKRNGDKIFVDISCERYLKD